MLLVQILVQTLLKKISSIVNKKQLFRVFKYFIWKYIVLGLTLNLEKLE